MRKSIEISKETVSVIESGKKVVGQVYIDQTTGKVTFKSFNRNNRKKDKLVRVLEHGWLKESATRFKMYESVPKGIGTTRVYETMQREMDTVKTTLVDRDIVRGV